MGSIPDQKPLLKTELLIVGAGPAGLKGTIISSAPGTAHTPRAHITNQAGLECLRDVDLEAACLSVATPSTNMRHTRWCRSMAGEEFARVHSWGHDPLYKGAYEAASPCRHVDLPQTLLEPILTKKAVDEGWALRFNTCFLSILHRDGEKVISEVEDTLTGVRYAIESKYLFGCDGARSQVVRELGIPLIKKPGQGLALNVLVKADITHLMQSRVGNLHWIFRPEEDETKSPAWGWAAVVRMVKAWDEWMFIFLPRPGSDVKGEDMEATREEYLSRVKEFIGDDSVKAEILDVGKWWIHETVAERYQDGNVFCLGDAVHRHPPFNGLGSNTCIQDAFNLAWKIAYVISGKAGRSLLSSYTVERQPVGVDIITRANQGLRDHFPWQEALGMLEPDMEKRKETLAEFDDPGPQGQKRRQRFRDAIQGTTTEFHGLGIEMNQIYVSDAVYLDDQEEGPPAPEDKVRTHVVTTYPGRRIPHAWLNSRVPGKQLSTIDLAGHGSFCLLVGPGGASVWKQAAKAVGERLGVNINSYSIGWKQDYEDVYFDWAKKSEVSEDGCVLVRPDRFVAWRSKGMVNDAAERLEKVLSKVLSI
ncbi:phenol 2-monooxygenase [Cladorrhinum sp. PSN259]|nr:phenol 2-monooxygenase [Cladorrhinum sp. PSN259]